MVATLLTDRLIPRGRDLRFGGRPRPSASVHDVVAECCPSFAPIFTNSGSYRLHKESVYFLGAAVNSVFTLSERSSSSSHYHTSSSIFTIAATTACCCCQKQQQNNIMMSSGNKMPLPLGQQHQKQNHHPIQNTIVSPSFGGAFII